MAKFDRWPAVIISEKVDTAEIHCKIDFNPKTGNAHGLMMWRTDGTGKGHDLDKTLDDLSRKISRYMQGRIP